jgi:hypothetical protein
MTASVRPQRRVRAMRWTARVWTLILAAFALMMALTPDPTIIEPVPWQDYFLLSLWGLAIAGLVIAWRLERVGALIAIGVMFLREIVWVILKGNWVVNFLIVWALVIPPAVLYLLASAADAPGQSLPEALF